MNADTRFARGAYGWLALTCVVVLLLAAGLWTATRDAGGTRLTAYFDRAVGLYADSSVRVLGVEVGTITEVRPQGSAVRVEMLVDDGVPVPAGVGAVVVAPTLVSDRYVQLTPAYSDGERIASGTVIPRERTETPIELDDLFASLDDLATTLGPDGANSEGALAGALDTVAENLDGNGANLSETVRQLARVSTTFESSKGDFFDTVEHLGSFTELLAKSDRQVGDLFDRVADVTTFLADESGEVDGALSTLATALTDVRGFVDDNDELLSSNVDKLAAVTKVLVDRRGELAEVLDVGPAGMNNFINAYDAASGTVGIRGNLNELTLPPVLMLCRLIAAGTPAEVPSTVADTCHELAPVLDGTVPLPSVSEVMAALGRGEPPDLPLPLYEAMIASSGGGGR
ncbi:MAG: MCE family protein [Actinophytocola sp.]|nr:MCE family protein [Actinophytocola sp.]